jgi:glycine/D-amino acid oxidase-like deaminating enzyme
VRAVELETNGGQQLLETNTLVLAAGPLTPKLAEMIGVTLPMYNELHTKVSIADSQLAVPRHSPLMIWSDPQQLAWNKQERTELNQDPDSAWLLEEFPAGVHTRPDGPDNSPILLMLWTYHTEAMPALYPPPHDELYYPEIVLRGLTTMLPQLKVYLKRLPKPYVDGGYYAKTEENRPLIGPLPVEGAYLIGALSGFGLMASPAAGELVAAHVLDLDLPDYQHWFRLERYQDPEYQALLKDWGSSGQL